MINTLELYASTLNKSLSQADDEYLKNSGISEGLRKLGNFRSVSGQVIYDYLCYSSKIKRLNTGRLPGWMLRKYAPVEEGAIVFRSLDPDTNWQDWMEWSRVRPYTPRIEEKDGKVKGIKYESPFGEPNRVTYFLPSIKEWKKVSERCNVEIPEVDSAKKDKKDDEAALDFWDWVERNTHIPISITEGEKKGAYLLGYGFTTIALPGIWNGRVGKKGFEQLHPDLRRLCRNGRKVTIVFDYETRLKTKWAVYNATIRLARCLEEAGCQVFVAMLPGDEKGVDDWGLAQGRFADDHLTSLFNDALPFQLYKTVGCPAEDWLVKYKADLLVNTRFLSEVVQLPSSGVVCLKSEMGTGKTELMRMWRDANPDEKFLNCGHRVNLLKNLSGRLKTKMYSDSLSPKNEQALSITVDSLTRITEGVEYGCLFVDEACQYLNHLLTSSTCKKLRADILELLESLVYRAKLVVLADAHLDDLTIEFFMSMRPQGEKPLVIQNDFKVPKRMVYWYEGQDPSMLVDTLKTETAFGKKCMLVSDSKKFVKKVERMLFKEQPNLKVWSIHSENSGSEENCHFIANIRDEVKTIDVLLASPSLGTGVDIPDYHFDSVFGVFMDVDQIATECAQHMWRYRPAVGLHVWVSPQPPFGYRETNPETIKTNLLQNNEETAFRLKIDRETGRRGVEKEFALDAYCQLKSQRNRSTNNLRGNLYKLLKNMGCEIGRLGEAVDQLQQLSLQEIGMELKEEFYQGVSVAKDITWQEYELRSQAEFLKPEERLEYEKFRIKKFYGMEVNPWLVELDNEGQFTRKIIALEETLEDGYADEGILYPAPLVTERDKKEREDYKISWDWKNSSLRWLSRERIGLRDILKALIEGESIAANDPRVEKLNKKALEFAPQVKQVLGITIAPNVLKGFWLVGQLLDQLGLKLNCKRTGGRGQQISVYSLRQEEWEFAQKVIAHREQERVEAVAKKAEKDAELKRCEQDMTGVTGSVDTPPLKNNLYTTGEGIATEGNQRNQQGNDQEGVSNNT